MSLNQAITSALAIKCDTTCFNELLAIRKKARERGIDDIDARIRRINLARQKPKPEPVEPPKQEEPENAIQTHETESNQTNPRAKAKHSSSLKQHLQRLTSLPKATHYRRMYKSSTKTRR